MDCYSRHALVTGASSGIGRATALTLAGRGFHVFATVRQLNDGEALLPLLRLATRALGMLGSIGDRLTPPFVGPLSASKHAVLALTEALRQELAAWNIRVVLIEPGNIRSEAGVKFEHETARTLD